MLVKETIKSRIKGYLQDKNSEVQDPEQALENFSEFLSSLIVDSIKSAQVNIPSGVISVVGNSGVSSNPAPITIPQGGLS